MALVDKIARSVAVVGIGGGIAAGATFSAFTSPTDNPGNVVASGAISLTDNDSGSSLYNVPTATPGSSSVPKCIQVTFNGDVPSTVKLYRSGFTNGTGLDPHVTLLVERVTGTNGTWPDCTNAANRSEEHTSELQSRQY